MDTEVDTSLTLPADVRISEGDAASPRAQRILVAAGEVFLTKGFDQATTLDIAARAHVSKRDLYRHFESKQGILEALIERHSRTMVALPDLGDPQDLEHLLKILDDFGQTFLPSYLDTRKIALYRIAIAEAPRSTRLGQALEAAGAQPVIGSSIAFMAKAVRRGIVAPEDAELAMSAYFDVLVGPWHTRLLTGTHPAPDAAAIDLQVARAVTVVRRIVLAGRSTL